MTARTFRRLLLVLVLCWVVLSLAAAAGLRRLGPWLVVNESLAKSDAIFVTDGGTPQRELEGAALFLEGWAPRVVLTLARDTLSEEVRGLSGEAAPQERSARVLVRRGVPEAAVIRLGRTVDNTQQELEADFEHARARGYRRVIIVSSAYHTRRIRLMWSSRFEATIPAIVRATRYAAVDPSRWWRSRRPLEDVVHEVLGITNFYLGSPIPTFERGG